MSLAQFTSPNSNFAGGDLSSFHRRRSPLIARANVIESLFVRLQSSDTSVLLENPDELLIKDLTYALAISFVFQFRKVRFRWPETSQRFTCASFRRCAWDGQHMVTSDLTRYRSRDTHPISHRRDSTAQML